MSIILNIREKLKDAMRAKDENALNTYRGLLSAFTNELVAEGKTPQDEVSDELALKVIKKVIKQRKDAIAQFEAASRPDLAEEDKKQLAILEEYQPAQMSEIEIEKIARAKKSELKIEDKTKSGILVGAVKKELGEAADGATIKKVIDSLF